MIDIIMFPTLRVYVEATRVQWSNNLTFRNETNDNVPMTLPDAFIRQKNNFGLKFSIRFFSIDYTYMYI